MAIRAVIFDAYGTLLDVGSASSKLVHSGKYPALGDKGDRLSEIWRTKQLSYTWLRSLMGAYVPFWQITQEALDFALAETGLDGDDDLRADLLSLYRIIDAYDDGKKVLASLADYPSIASAILSNGNQEMLDEAVGAAGIGGNLDRVLSVEDLAIYKPSPQVYQMGCAAFDVAPDEVLFFSANGWDIAGAGQFGYQTIWVNRTNQSPENLGHHPLHMVRNLDEAWQVAQPLLA